jgi:hypothetical protein
MFNGRIPRNPLSHRPCTGWDHLERERSYRIVALFIAEWNDLDI